MREIKFRGKRADNDEWIYGNLIYEKSSNRAWIDVSYYGEIAVIPKTVGQFTGLKDENGNEIYEGDIVQDNRWRDINMKTKGVVEFCINGDVASCECYNFFVGSGFKADFVDLTCCIIIGNIHDNPELIKNK